MGDYDSEISEPSRSRYEFLDASRRSSLFAGAAAGVMVSSYLEAMMEVRAFWLLVGTGLGAEGNVGLRIRLVEQVQATFGAGPRFADLDILGLSGDLVPVTRTLRVAEFRGFFALTASWDLNPPSTPQIRHELGGR